MNFLKDGLTKWQRIRHTTWLLIVKVIAISQEIDIELIFDVGYKLYENAKRKLSSSNHADIRQSGIAFFKGRGLLSHNR